MAGLRCHECLKEYETLDHAFDLYDHETDCEYSFDTIDCLLSYAWRIKEQQPKLSKSKQEFAPIITLGPYGPLKEGLF